VLALVEAIGGRERAEHVGRTLGVASWGPEHNSEQFGLTARDIFTVTRNEAAFWLHEELGVEVEPGTDEIRVALIADAYGRTRRSPPVTVAGSAWFCSPIGSRVRRTRRTECSR
jgi:hypothetical protein